MQRNDTFKLAAVAAALILTPAILLAQPPGRDGGGFGHRGGPMGDFSPIDRLAERLDLTEDQRQAIETLFDDYREDLELHGQAVRDAHGALADAAGAEILDEDAVRAVGQELGGALAEMAIVRTRLHQEIRQQLTPEQQELFDQGERRRYGRRGRGFGPRGGGFGPGGGGSGGPGGRRGGG